MSTSYIDFNYEEIFPTCKKEYDIAIGPSNFKNRSKYRTLCNNIKDKIANKDPTFTFICEDFSLYLEHIKEKKGNDVKNFCMYFFYKIIDELKEKKYPCVNNDKCYEEIMSASKGESNSLFSICNNMNRSINGNVVSIFHYLDKLYNELELFSYGSYTCLTDSKTFEEYMNLLQQYDSNNSLKIILYTLNKEYKPYKEKLHDCLIFSKIFHHLLKTFASLIVLAFTISTIIFILYKYTPYSPYVYPIVRKIISLWKRRNEEKQELHYTFETEYKNLTENNYQLLHNPVEY
ncbi:variable surface protein [Plasmodium gonderi]|uniref:Variable surface protein n=1 Tax=Plasmodium gonderi TaxID=77519 RepID=A0A1Y1JQC4_PLAGO|nr:variable surface protein [Plasmodium gonderi]GAW84639.1 variable surface protein [Plasmodium gonderi]